jgi:tRNA threonylcarbamoyl adenosine modification protein YeaZ
MYLLAFDTSVGAASAAVARLDATGTRVVCESFERRLAGHAERLLPMLQQTMQEAGVGFRDIGRIAVTLGPGSFTGVRTGIATARALALAIGCPAVGIDSLATIAATTRLELGEASKGRAIAVAVAAGRDRVYFSLFGPSGETLSGPGLALPQDCAQVVAGMSVALLVGSGAARLATAGVAAEEVLTEAVPRAGVVARLGATVAVGDPLRPLYLRPPDAKPQVGGAFSGAWL